MPVLEVSMMTGFAPDVISLNKLKRGMEKFGMSNKANDKGPIIFYLDKMKHREDECFTLNVNRIYKVGLIQPGSVTVYDHYKPENRCTKFYHMEKDRKSLYTICQNSVCRCAEDSCFQQQHPGDIIYAAWRYHKACSPGVDYVYRST
ncbi:hypothetical protein GDO81_024584 [Engystomops pustulosus]|uniref:Alpha-macroglobulin receptor-binding domain-containing protein n=1 Tax=Engystomops pustulosus TaxID=76066 RepID=A0AAV6ZN84_ENGPU|nr:hypothetical protein GDO81_024584 [Engystomops pustulosus]